MKLGLFFLLVLLFACNEQTIKEVPVYRDGQSQSSTVKVIFPHSKEFKITALHGRHYHQQKKVCQSCHMPMDEATEELNQEFCLNCHKSYPHSEEFKSSFQHGTEFLKDRDNCMSCHQAEHKPGTTTGKKACLECHQYPHRPAWTSKFHQDGYWQNKVDEKMQMDCQQCHIEGGDFHQRNEEHFVDCQSCHYQLPHDFSSFMKHRKAANKYDKDCLTCHEPLDKYWLNDDFPADEPTMQCSGCHNEVGLKFDHQHDWEKLFNKHAKPKRKVASPPKVHTRPRGQFKTKVHP